MKNRCLIASCAALLAVGCVPYTSTFYHPSADGGRLRSDLCGAFGNSDKIEFQRSGAVIKFSASGRILYMTIALPEGDSAVISPPTALLSSSLLGEPDILSAEIYYSIDKYGNYDIRPINEPIIGFIYKKTPQHTYYTQRTYNIMFIGAKKFPDTFEIEPPKIWINGKLVELPKITFKWGTSLAISPINC